MTIDLYTTIGFIGTGVIVSVYFANQQGWLASDHWLYPFANLIGAILILISLLFEWNFPSVVIEIFWIAISLYGLVRAFRRRRSAA
jgi:hypothetical protein